MSVCRLCLYVAIAGPEQQLYQLEREQESPAVFIRSVLYLRILWHYTATVFDDGNAYPVQIADLVEDMKKLDASSLEHLVAIVKEMVGNK